MKIYQFSRGTTLVRKDKDVALGVQLYDPGTEDLGYVLDVKMVESDDAHGYELLLHWVIKEEFERAPLSRFDIMGIQNHERLAEMLVNKMHAGTSWFVDPSSEVKVYLSREEENGQRKIILHVDGIPPVECDTLEVAVDIALGLLADDGGGEVFDDDEIEFDG